MIVALALACLAPVVLADGGELTFPVGAAEPGTLAIRVVDRNRIPLAGATVRGGAERAGGAQALRDPSGASAAFVALEPAVTDAEGRAILSAPDDAWCGVVVERPGFAPTPFRPLHAGHTYELVVDMGAALVVACADPDGHPVAAELAVEHHLFPQLPDGVRVERRAHTGVDATARITGVPRGRTVVHARGADGSRGYAELHVGSAWRHNALFGAASEVHVTMHPTVERTLPVTDAGGAAVPGLRSALAPFGPEDWSAVEVVEGEVRVTGLSAAPPEGEFWLAARTLRLWAPGWRALQLSLSVDDPPSAWTEPVPLAGGVDVPPFDGEGELWIPCDPVGNAPWTLRAPDAAALRPAVGYVLAGARVDDGRVAGWLRAEFGDAEVACDWVEPAAIALDCRVDGAPYRCGFVSFELVAGSLGGRLPAGLATRHFTFVGPDGRCALRGLVPGRYELHLSTSYVDHASSRAFVDVAAGATVELALHGTRGATVTGRVVDASGLPVGGGVVVVAGEERTTVSEGNFAVAQDGTFAVTGLVEGTAYTLFWTSDEPQYVHVGRFAESPPIPMLRTASARVSSPLPESIEIVVE